MQIQISDDRYIHEVQSDFQKEYPFLKIEFYRPINKMQRQVYGPQIISGASPIEAVRRVDKKGMLNIDKSRSVAEIENDLKNIFGLQAEIYRKSANLWIETSLTDHWSLYHQNQEGMQMSSAHSAS